mmetsp:Transcript_27527/g.67970  ORF Transcript_27527/g.67970 Transcript_27527/m.67970 type:complete len:371 (+) Transcript_27527:87-1199(+)
MSRNKGGLVGRLVGRLEGNTVTPKGAVAKQVRGLPDAEAMSLAYATGNTQARDHEEGSMSSANTPDKGGDGSMTARTTRSTTFTDGALTSRSAEDFGGALTSRTVEGGGSMTARSAMTDYKYKATGEKKRKKKPTEMSPSLIGSVCSDVSDEMMSDVSGGLTQRSMLSDGGMTDRTERSGHRTDRSGRDDRRGHRSKSRGPGGKRDRSEARSGFGTARGEREDNLDFHVVPEEGEGAPGKSEPMAEDRAADLEARLMSSGLTPKMATLGKWTSPRASASKSLFKDSFMPITPTSNPVFKRGAIVNPDALQRVTRAVVAASPRGTPTARGYGTLPPRAPKTPISTPKVKGCGIRLPMPFKRGTSSKLLKDK